MRKRFQDESGIAMPLAMIMVVLIGVMGAGLLVFASTDLNSVVEVNRGQRAIEMAEAGVQAAKMQLRDSPDSSDYESGDPWHTGKWVELDGEKSFVTIRPTPTSTPAEPFYAVTSTSTIGSGSSQARRKVQAIFRAYGWGVKAYYTPGSIFISPDDMAVRDNGAGAPGDPSSRIQDEYLGSQLQDRVDIRGVSLFAGRDVVISDNKFVTYRRFNGTGSLRRDSVTGGGLVYNFEYFCIYENAVDPSSGYNFESRFNANTSSRCERFFDGGTGEYNTGTFGGDPDEDTAVFPSAWEKYNSAKTSTDTDMSDIQPHIRIIANAECPEIAQQWDSQIGSANYNDDALDAWNNQTVFNATARLLDPTQTYRSTDHNTPPTPPTLASPNPTSGPAPCQDVGDPDNDGDADGNFPLEGYPTSTDPDGDGVYTTPERYQPAGIAAEGKICRASGAVSEPYTVGGVTTNYWGCNNSPAVPSIASFRVGDIRGGAGRIGYDSTTTPIFYDKRDQLPSIGGVPADARTDPTGTTWADDISYPFDPAQDPDIEGLYRRAVEQGRYIDGNPSSSQWQAAYPSATANNRVVVFVDAHGANVTLPQELGGSATAEQTRGILVVRCGNLTNMRTRFNGIILVLAKPAPGGVDAGNNCEKKGNYRSSKPRRGAESPTNVRGYVYAQGYGDNSSADIDPRDGVPDFRYSIAIADASDINRLPRGEDYRDLTQFVGAGLEGVQLESWRECYSADPNTC